MPCPSERKMTKKEKIIKYKTLNKRKGLKKLSELYKQATGVMNAGANTAAGTVAGRGGGAGQAMTAFHSGVSNVGTPQLPTLNTLPTAGMLMTPSISNPVLGSQLASIKPIGSR